MKILRWDRLNLVTLRVEIRARFGQEEFSSLNARIAFRLKQA